MPRRRMKRIKIVERKLGHERVMGLAYAEGLIEVDPRQRARVMMNTLIHEATHLAMPSLSESAVKKIAGKATRVLWAMDYRRLAK